MCFSDKYFYENCRTCNFFVLRLRMLILFLNDVDIQLILEFKEQFWKKSPSFSKNPLSV